MTTEEKRIKIAEACGLKTIRRDYHWRIGDHLVHGNGTIVPAYFNDLNAMHEAEKSLDSEQRGDYANALCWACHPVKGEPWTAVSRAFFATAAQRAEAFGLTMGLWKEGD